MIGIFDSGSGGLTVLHKIKDVLPSADVVYFGDIKNAPYGSRTQANIALLTVNGLHRLRESGAARIVSACNSTAASLAISLFDTMGIAPQDLIEMVGPTVSYIKDTDARVGLCATPATIASGVYQNAFTMVGKKVHAIPIPELAGAIEFGKSREEIRSLIAGSLELHAKDMDILVLACTHYPLVKDIFEEVLPGIYIFDPAEAVAERVFKQFWPQEVGNGLMKFLISKNSQPFKDFVQKLFPGEHYTIEVVE